MTFETVTFDIVVTGTAVNGALVVTAERIVVEMSVGMGGEAHVRWSKIATDDPMLMHVVKEEDSQTR